MSDETTVGTGSEESPVYAKCLQDDGFATPRYMITVDEGWRQSIICCDMYEWAADWLVEQLQGKPYAKAASHVG